MPSVVVPLSSLTPEQPLSDLQERQRWIIQVQLSRANHGGRQQRSNAANVQLQRNILSPLAQALLENFAFGILCGPQLYRYVTLAVREGAAGQILSDISKLTSRVHMVFRLVNTYIIEHYPAAICPTTTTIPLYVHKGTRDEIGTRLLPHYYLPPHRWLHYLYTNYRFEFYNRAVGSPSAITNFWQSINPMDSKLLILPDHIRHKPTLFTTGTPII